MLFSKQAMSRRLGVAASLGDSNELVECFGELVECFGGVVVEGGAGVVVEFVGEGVEVGRFG